MISAHARTLRTSQVETFNAIAKMKEIRGHAEGFAENMLSKAMEGKPPDMDATWSAFSGVLTTEQLVNAEWGEVKKKAPGSRSKGAFNITAFQVAESAAPPAPIQHTVLQLTDVKVIVQPTPDGYAAPVDPSNFLLPWATGGRGKTRKRTRYDGDDDSDAASADDDDEEEEEDDDDDGSQ